MAKLLASHVEIYMWVGTFPVTSLPFEDHLSTLDRLEKQAPGKADQGTIGMIDTCIVNSLM